MMFGYATGQTETTMPLTTHMPATAQFGSRITKRGPKES
jgi:S-adenosylmethionine synthetase